jgi:RimJ/RimL family protein N-acetyltransferase
MREDASVSLVDPSYEQVLEFCARDPVERVFLEDVARRGLGRFWALEDGSGWLQSLCHVGANLVPSGERCEVFAAAAAGSGSRMIIGEERAVGELWEAAADRLPTPREDRPGQPVFAITEPPAPGDTGLRAADLHDLDELVPVCAIAHAEELGIDPLARDGEGFRWRTRAQIEDGRSWVWIEDGVICFKAEASAWTPGAVQVQQVWVDPAVRRRGYGARGMRDLCRLLLETTPTVTLFVRTENTAAIGLYESIGMEHAGNYRSILF